MVSTPHPFIIFSYCRCPRRPNSRNSISNIEKRVMVKVMLLSLSKSKLLVMAWWCHPVEIWISKLHTDLMYVRAGTRNRRLTLHGLNIITPSVVSQYHAGLHLCVWWLGGRVILRNQTLTEGERVGWLAILRVVLLKYNAWHIHACLPLF